MVTIRAFLLIPLLALIAAVPLMWGRGIGWVDLMPAAVFFTVSTLGITGGYHRYFTHGSFKANRPLRIALAIMGALAAKSSVIGWVADHRRHHAFWPSDAARCPTRCHRPITRRHGSQHRDRRCP